jgi:hypothetical protein
MNIDGTAAATEIPAPHLFQNLLTRKRLPAMAGEEEEQVELLGLKEERSIFEQRLSPCSVNHKIF